MAWQVEVDTGSKEQLELAKIQRAWFCKVFGLVSAVVISQGQFCPLKDIRQYLEDTFSGCIRELELCTTAI